MKAVVTKIPEVLVIEPKVFADERGFFFESFNQEAFQELTGLNVNFVQDNHSRSTKGVLRGLHHQVVQPQGKLVRVVQGEIFDVSVDIRPDSSTYGQWVGFYLSAENKKQLWMPSGFAHGFLTLSETADVLYKATDYYAPEFERVIAWNDPKIGINWPLTLPPSVSAKDCSGYFIS
jgi:dTDP-4-dehydrorhamnose 3,5-epimerase